MKKVMRLGIATVILLGAAITSNAQLQLGANAGYFGSGLAGGQPAIGLRGEYNIEDNLSIVGSANYFVPKSFATEYQVYKNADQGSYDYFKAKDKVGCININAEAKRYTFGKEYEDDVAPYFLLGAGLNFWSYGTKFDTEPDPSVYDVPDMTSETYFGFSINAGFGADFMLGDNILGVEGKLMIPATQVNGAAIEVQIPAAYGIFVNYRIPF